MSRKSEAMAEAIILAAKTKMWGGENDQPVPPEETLPTIPENKVVSGELVVPTKDLVAPVAESASGGDHRNPEFGGMPAHGKSQLRAIELAVALEELDVKKTTADERRSALMAQMRADELYNVVCQTVAGFVYDFTRETGEEKIKVKKG